LPKPQIPSLLYEGNSVPKGRCESSPGRQSLRENPPVPQGLAERYFQPSLYGTGLRSYTLPSTACWATLSRPCGTESLDWSVLTQTRQSWVDSTQTEIVPKGRLNACRTELPYTERKDKSSRPWRDSASFLTYPGLTSWATFSRPGNAGTLLVFSQMLRCGRDEGFI
jgi:hypothetical protein